MNNIKHTSIKVVLKVFDEILEKQTWVHFCYVEKDLYVNFLNEFDITSNDLNEQISKWVRKDFGFDLKIETTNQLDYLRNTIKNRYKEIYPELYIESNTDNQGWIRVWVTKHMKEDLSINESEN